MRPAPIADRSSRLTGSICAALFVGTLILFSRSIGHDFVNYDDVRYVTGNLHLRDAFGWSTLAWIFGGSLELWQPITWFSHLLDWKLYGAHAAGHHFTSVFFHAANAALAFLVLRRLAAGVWLCAFAVALYAWHPLRVESVSWIAERKDVLSGTFFFITLWCYLRYGEARRAGHHASGRFCATLAAYAAGLMAKPTLVTLPALLLALDAWPLFRLPWFATQTPLAAPRESLGRIVAEKIPFAVMAAAVSLITIRLQHARGDFILDLPLLARLENVPVALTRYVGKLVWPANLTVCYPHPGWWPAGTVVACCVLVLLIAVVAWRTRETQPWILLGVVWFGALLLPTIGILQVGFQSMADRYTYLPALGAEIAVLWTLRRAIGAWTRTTQITLALLALGPLATRTWQQQGTWSDSLTLFNHAVAVTPTSAVAQSFLGYTLSSLGRDAEAASHCERAIALDPSNETAEFTLAKIDANAGRVEAAIAHFRRSLELKPDDHGTEYELGLQLLLHGDTDEATALLRKAAHGSPEVVILNRELAAMDLASGHQAASAVRMTAGALMEPENPDAQLAAGIALNAAGRTAEARTAYERALALKPDFAEAHAQLGLLLLNHHDPASASTHLRRALELAPHLADAQVGLGRIEEQSRNGAEADRLFQAALAGEPNNGEIARAWADVLAHRGRFADAVVYYRRAAELRPNDAAIHAGLGYVLLLSGDRAGAAAAWREALRLDPNFPGIRQRLAKLAQ